jgi:hypothetical protein
MQRLVTHSFISPALIDVCYNDSSNGTPGVVPASVDRSPGAFPDLGHNIGWNWIGGTLGADMSSTLLVIHCNAGYGPIPVLDSVIGGSVASVASYGLEIPEPSTISIVAALATALQFSRCHAWTRSGSSSSKC